MIDDLKVESFNAFFSSAFEICFCMRARSFIITLWKPIFIRPLCSLGPVLCVCVWFWGEQKKNSIYLRKMIIMNDTC